MEYTYLLSQMMHFLTFLWVSIVAALLWDLKQDTYCTGTLWSSFSHPDLLIPLLSNLVYLFSKTFPKGTLEPTVSFSY